MPTVLRIGQYRFFFYINEDGEPVHIHVQHESKLAKFWLKPVNLARSTRFKPHELGKIEKLIKMNHKKLLDAWNDCFSD